jgi:hypothetical protein
MKQEQSLPPSQNPVRLYSEPAEYSHLNSSRYTLILFTHLRVVVASDIFPQYFPSKISNEIWGF